MNTTRSLHLLCACSLLALACSNPRQVPAVAESAIAVEVGTLTPPGDALYWDGICGTFTVQPGYYSPGDHFFAVGAPTVAVESEADARDGGLAVTIDCDPGFDAGVDTHAMILVLGRNFVDCESGDPLSAEIANAQQNESDIFVDTFLASPCQAGEVVQLDGRFETLLAVQGVDVNPNTSVPPGNSSYPNGICAAYTGQLLQLDPDGNAIPYSQAIQQLYSLDPFSPSEPWGPYTEGLTEAMLDAAGQYNLAGGITVGCIPTLPVPQPDTQLALTASDFFDCVTGAPIPSLAGKSVSRSSSFNCLAAANNISPDAAVAPRFELGLPDAGPSSACGAVLLSTALQFDSDAGPADTSSLFLDLALQAYSVDINGVRTPFGPPLDQALSSGCLSTLPAPAQDWSIDLTVNGAFDAYGDPPQWMASPQTVTVNLRCDPDALTMVTASVTLVPGSTNQQ